MADEDAAEEGEAALSSVDAESGRTMTPAHVHAGDGHHGPADPKGEIENR